MDALSDGRKYCRLVYQSFAGKPLKTKTLTAQNPSSWKTACWSCDYMYLTLALGIDVPSLVLYSIYSTPYMYTYMTVHYSYNGHVNVLVMNQLM